MYLSIVVNSLTVAMNGCVPVLRKGSLKPFWSPKLQEASVDAYKMWNICGRPRNGLLNRVRLECNYKYKLAMKEEELLYNMECDDELSNLYLIIIIIVC